MSFTLYHSRKDGTIKPIKVSIFDAFRGVPDPKPRKRQPCSCCGKIHSPKAKSEVTPEAKAEDKAAEKDGKATDGEKKDDNDTEADDQIMLSMKAKDVTTPWKDILAATSYTDESELKARWRQVKDKLPDFKKELEAKSEGKGDEEKDKNNKNEAKDPEREAKAAKNREEGLKRQQEKKDKAAGKAYKNKKVESKSKTTGETAGVKMWADSYDKKKWRLMASKHYDRTGQRISPEQARKMVEGK
ncbi:hypothetical protein A1O1_08045 [Capronia coronata CBS 617.96]|uniref:Uncharacterized protein n=1 Tax=Capronia coronata CBS 617.96 TaxID=1182541 RepID=W9XP50_9EURO|nr:uncharacterized protein A1O1_08045 [Capronia coronata CBS 617.96]EXJ81978.1 hypothetical protein A1O1_08045 [Capronia coronata CBS 617.96]